jgi:DNA-binding winged helix-turn-helix (wHTH) protein/tetratricopeptide (TPR) repeat protein
MRTYHFGPFILDAQERRLVRDGELISLTPKAFDLLVYMVEHQGRLLEKDALMEAVWKDSIVEEGNLPRTIHVLRKSLGTGEDGAEYIETVPTKGYRFVAPAARLAGNPPAESLIRPVEAKAEIWQAGGSLMRRRLVAVAGGVLLLALAGSTWHRFDLNDKLRSLLPSTSSGAAYVKYQSGRLHMERQFYGDHAAALKDFEKAIELDPHFAAAYAGKADASIFLYWASGSHDDIAQARMAVSKAIELDPDNSYARVLLCRIRATYDWDFASAERECRRAVELDPRNHEARRELAFLMSAIGKKDKAMEEMNIAIALAPTSFNKRSRGLLLYFTRRFDEAIAQFKQVQATDPEFSESLRWMSRSFEQKGDYLQALEFHVKSREATGGTAEEMQMLRRAFASSGWPAVLRASLAMRPPRPNLENAGSFAQLGQKDQAFEVLEGMIKNRRVMMVHLDNDPRLDPLRSDPRFEQLAKRVGLR